MKNLKRTFMIVFTVMILTTGFCNNNEITNNQIEWVVKTNLRTYKGVSNSLSDAKVSIAFITIGEVIENVKYNEIKKENEKITFIYVWEIETNEGIVQGSSNTFEHAKNCLKILSENSMIYSKSITKEGNLIN